MNLPSIEFAQHDPLQDYYSDGMGNWYSVARLIDAAKDFEPFEIPIAGIDLDFRIWKDCNMFGLASHVKRSINADLSKPIILDWNGSVADGRHRIIKALVNGDKTVKAVRLTHAMTPDRVDD